MSDQAPTRGPLFLRPEVFEEHLRAVPTRSGGEFVDLETPFGDLSRLVAAWLATTPAEELVTTYKRCWGGYPQVRAVQSAAKDWLRRYHPERAVALGIDTEPT